MSKKQLLFSSIPFLGSIIFILTEFLAGRRKYFEMMLSLLPAMLISFILCIVFGVIGFLSYTVTLIISLCITGWVWNVVFFMSLNKKDKANKQ